MLDQVETSKHKVVAVSFLSTRREAITNKPYFVVRLFDELDVVDDTSSVIEQSAKYSFLTVTRHLSLDPTKIGGCDLFRIKNTTMGRQLFCSLRFRAAAEAEGLARQQNRSDVGRFPCSHVGWSPSPS